MAFGPNDVGGSLDVGHTALTDIVSTFLPTSGTRSACSLSIPSTRCWFEAQVWTRRDAAPELTLKGVELPCRKVASKVM
jgi:hypothetical protein